MLKAATTQELARDRRIQICCSLTAAVLLGVVALRRELTGTECAAAVLALFGALAAAVGVQSCSGIPTRGGVLMSSAFLAVGVCVLTIGDFVAHQHGLHHLDIDLSLVAAGCALMTAATPFVLPHTEPEEVDQAQ